MSEENGKGDKDNSFTFQNTMDDREEGFNYQQTMSVNPNSNEEGRGEESRQGNACADRNSEKEDLQKEGEEGSSKAQYKLNESEYTNEKTKTKPKVETSNSSNNNTNVYMSSRMDEIFVTSKNDYFLKLEEYKKIPNCKIDPSLHFADEIVEVEHYVINEKICTATYIQYIDVYEGVIDADEGIEEEEEIEYVELPKYITLYKPKIIVNTIEKTIEVPSGEEIKKPKYNNVDVPYIIPNIIKNEILVVLKKIIQPQIEVTNEVLEVEVQKYIPKLIPVNVYVPRHFGISAKVKGVPEETIRFVDLTQEQIDALMKELNPHLEELKQFNENQLKRMDEYIKESQQQAKANNFEIPEPLAVSYDEQGNCKHFEYSEFNKIKEAYISELIH